MQAGTLLAACVLTTAASGIALWALIRISPLLGLIDRPDARKHHHGDIPLVGGIAVLAGVLAGATWLGNLTRFDWLLLITAAAQVLVGAIDDRRNLRVRVRVVVQVALIGAMILFGGEYVHTLGSLSGLEFQLGWFGIPFTVVAMVGLLNAFNLIDGIDGLATAMALVAIAGILLTGTIPVTHVLASLLLLMGCALLPFLAANLGLLGARNRCFLGDAGSTLLGYVLGWSLIHFSQNGHTALSPVSTLWCVALPVMDVFAVMTRRVLEHKNPFKPDRGHIHHLLLHAGFGRGQILLMLTALAAGMWLFGNTVKWLELGAGSNLAAFCLVATFYIAETTRVWRRQQASDRAIATPRAPVATEPNRTGTVSGPTGNDTALT